MSESANFSSVDFTSTAELYNLHSQLAANANASRQVAEGPLDPRDVPELDGAVGRSDTAKWDIEMRPLDDPTVPKDLVELAEYATDMHTVAGVVKRAEAATDQGVLDMANTLIAAAFQEHGDTWHADALLEDAGFAV